MLGSAGFMGQPKELEEGFIPLLEESQEAGPVSFGLSSAGADANSPDSRKIAAKHFIADRFLRLLVQDLDFNAFMQELLLDILKVVECEAASVVEIDYQKNIMFFRSATGFSSDSIRRFTIPRGHGIAGQCAEGRKSILIDEVSENKNHLKSLEKSVGFKTSNMLASPILVRGRSFAVLELLNRKKADSFTQDDLEIVEYACDMAAKAVEVRMILAWAHSKPSEGGKAA